MPSDAVRIIKSGDVNQSVTVAGSGPLVILMHGWPELGLSYRHQIAPLAAAGYTVAVPDMRGYGGTSKPADPNVYDHDTVADDMLAIADALGADRWVSVGHDWGSPIAWRTALRFPDRVAGVFSLGVPHRVSMEISGREWFDTAYADRFYYMRYFEPVGPAESELERDPRDALKRIFFALSGDAPFAEWIKRRPIDSTLLDGLALPPVGPLSFMTDAELDAYAEQFKNGGFFGPLCWYRNWDRNEAQTRAYGSPRIEQPVGFLCGSKEIVLAMFDHGIERQRELCRDLRMERILPGAGHWIQQERPADVSAAMIGFLNDIRDRI
jgi:pimeloyl-ACP methyl ester carboxylesterase